MKISSSRFTVALAVILFALDRCTKWYAVKHLAQEYCYNSCISFETAFNRGISWGILSFDNPLIYAILSLVIIGVTLFFIHYSLQQWRTNKQIIGESLVLIGAISNLADRFFYKGVVDFISISAYGWSWPAFNMADVYIVIGIFLIVFFRKN